MTSVAHPIDVHNNPKYSDEHDDDLVKEHSVHTSTPSFYLPLLAGSIIFIAWTINNLMIQFFVQTDLAMNTNPLLMLIYNLSTTSFVIQASTFAMGVTFAWYATHSTSGLYYYLSAIYNAIIVAIWFIYVVEPYGFFQWRHSDTIQGQNPFPQCFFTNPRPSSYNQDLCNNFKAASIFSFFIMLIHATWFLLHTMRAIHTSSFRFISGTTSGHTVLNLFAYINIASYIIWLGGRLALADKYGAVDSSLVTYLITLSVAISTLLILAYTSEPTVVKQFQALVWNTVTALMLASTVIFLARVSDNSTTVATLDPKLSTDSGKAVVASQMIMLCSTTIASVILTLTRYKFL